MNKVNGIRIFCIAAVALGIGCYQAVSFQRVEEEPEPVETEVFIVEETESEVETEAEASVVIPAKKQDECKFVIVEEGDYLTVYHADRETVYEYTDIRYSDLEDSLRQKIRKGYEVKDEEALFGFLENYSI